MNYPQILGKLVNGFWLVTEEKHYAMLSVLEARMGGQAVFTDAPQDKGDDEGYQAFGGTAIIPVHGILGKHLSSLEASCGGCSMERVSTMLDVADNDASINRIILDISSPGGTVTGTPELGDKISNISDRKKVIAFSDSEACSGALWLAACANYFYMTQSATTGSCGVRMVLLDTTKALDKEGVKVNPIFSGKYKLSGASFKPLEDDERAMFQAESDRIHTQFKEAVNSNRTVDDSFLQGQIFRAEEAAKIGMIDGIVEDLDDLLENFKDD